jgi:hypothetical protein
MRGAPKLLTNCSADGCVFGRQVVRSAEADRSCVQPMGIVFTRTFESSLAHVQLNRCRIDADA